MPDTGVVAPPGMPDDEEIIGVLRDRHGYAQAVEVLNQLRVGREHEIPNELGLNLEAERLQCERAAHWLAKLRSYGCLEAFVLRMRGRKLLLQDIPLPTDGRPDSLGSFDDKLLGLSLIHI